MNLDILYIIFGFLVLLIIIDWLVLKPISCKNKTEKLLAKLKKSKKITFTKKYETGILMVLTNDTFKQGLLNITILKRYYSTKIPICIAFINNDFLSSENIFYLKQLYTDLIIHQLTENIEPSFQNTHALIECPFKQVIFINPDNLFFYNPELLLNDPFYKETGALFWKDKPNTFGLTLNTKRLHDFFRELIPYKKKGNDILNKTSSQQQTNNLFLFNCEKHEKALSKLAVLLDEKHLLTSYISNDNELLWLSCELAQEPYYFIEHPVASVGETPITCKNVIYKDSFNRFLSIFMSTGIKNLTDLKFFKENDDLNELPQELTNLFNDWGKILSTI